MIWLRSLFCFTSVVCILAASLHAQQATPSIVTLDSSGPAFEVATIRPAAPIPPEGGWVGIRLAPSGRFTVRAMSLNSVIGYAYRAHDMLSHVQGGPDWLSSTQYDIEAKVDDSQMTDWDKLTDAERDDRVRPMLRQLLAERFQLKLHEETRETPVYLLVLAKGGPKFKQTSAPEPLPGDGDPIQQTLRFMRDHPGQSIPGNLMCTGNGCSGHNVDFQYAWGQIGASARAEYPVLDRTGLKGYYDISYTISRGPDAATPMQQIEDQLGLRFESSKAPTVSFIIDSAKKPTEN